MIHQFYFTHCTYASSALERKSGEVAHHPMGYSVRSASMKGAGLRDVFRRLERCVYFHLPSDTPASEKGTLTAKDAPKRLLFLPDTDCGPVLLRLAYRTQDTAGRIGSYFCHALAADPRALAKAVSGNGTEKGSAGTAGYGDRGGDPLTASAALQLWDASGWVQEDAEWFPHDIPELSSLSELLQSRSPAIDERVLASFLLTEPGGEFFDPHGIILPRWRKMLVSERQHIFKTVLYGFRSTYAQAGEPLLLAAEPEAAALIFYGVCRFFPQNLTRTVSFSTYEPNPERLLTKMAAVTFHEPEKTDLNEAVYQGRSFVLNTWNGRTSEFDPQAMTASYVGHVWKQFLAGGMAQVQLFCQTFSGVGISRMTDLKAMMEVENVFHQILADEEVESVPGSKPLPASLSELPLSASRMAVTLLKRRLAEGLTKIMELPSSESETRLKRIVGKAGQFLLLELLGTGGNLPQVQKAVLWLTERLPEKFLGHWLKNSPAGDEFKAKILRRRLEKNHALPTGCEFLWKLTADSVDSLSHSGNVGLDAGTVPGPKPPIPNAAVLPEIFQKMPLEPLCECFRNEQTADFRKEMVVACTLGISRFVEREGALNEKALELRRKLDAFIAQVPEPLFGEIYRTYGNWFFLNYPGDSHFLGEKFTCLEEEIFRKTADISAKLEILFDIQDILPEKTAPRVRRWRALQKAMLPVTTFQAQSGKKLQTRALEQACESMAQTAYAVFDDVRLLAQCGGPAASQYAKIGKISKVQRNLLAEKQMELLAELCRQWYSANLLPHGNRTHEWMRKKLKFYFQTQSWNAAKMNPLGNQALILMILGGIGIGLLAVFLFFVCFMGSGNGKSGESAEQTEISADGTSGAAADGAWDGKTVRGTEDDADDADEGDADEEKSIEKAEKKKGKGKNSRTKGTKNAAGNMVRPEVREDGAPAEEAYTLETGRLAGAQTEKGNPDGGVDVRDEMSELDSVEQNAELAENVSETSGAGAELVSAAKLGNEAPGSEIDASALAMGVPYRPTLQETLTVWDQEMEKNGQMRRVSLSMVPLRFHAEEMPYVLTGSQPIRMAGGFTPEEMQGLALEGGYVLFEGTAYPFGSVPACVTAPQKMDAEGSSSASGFGSSVGMAGSVGDGKKRRKHVLKSEDLETVHVEDEPGVRFHVPELARALGMESAVVEMGVNSEDLPCLYVRVQRKAADTGERQKRGQIEEELKELDGRIEDLQRVVSLCEKELAKKVRSETVLNAFRELAAFVGKRTALTIPSVEDPADGVQVERARTARERVFREEIPKLLGLGKEKLVRYAEERSELLNGLPSENGWTPTEMRIVERLQGKMDHGAGKTQISALFSGNFLFRVPFPPRAQAFLASAEDVTAVNGKEIGESAVRDDGDLAEESVSDPFGDASRIPSTGIQPFPLTQEELGTKVRFLSEIEDFSVKTDVKKAANLPLGVSELVNVRFLANFGKKNGASGFSVTAQVRQLCRGKARPVVQIFPELPEDGAEVQILREAEYVLVSFQLQPKSSAGRSGAPIYVTPYYQIRLGEEDEEESGTGSSRRTEGRKGEGRRVLLNFRLENDAVKRILQESRESASRGTGPMETDSRESASREFEGGTASTGLRKRTASSRREIPDTGTARMGARSVE